MSKAKPLQFAGDHCILQHRKLPNMRPRAAQQAADNTVCGTPINPLRSGERWYAHGVSHSIAPRNFPRARNAGERKSVSTGPCSPHSGSSSWHFAPRLHRATIGQAAVGGEHGSSLFQQPARRPPATNRLEANPPRRLSLTRAHYQGFGHRAHLR